MLAAAWEQCERWKRRILGSWADNGVAPKKKNTNTFQGFLGFRVSVESDQSGILLETWQIQHLRCHTFLLPAVIFEELVRSATAKHLDAHRTWGK